MVGIVGSIATVTSALFLGGFKLWQVNRVKVEIQRDARATLDLMNKYLRQASASSLTLDRYNSNQPAYSRCTFTYLDTARAAHSVEFRQDGRIMYLLFDGNKVVMTRNLRNVLFYYPDSTNDKLMNVSICYEATTFTGGTKALQLSVQKVRVMNP